MRSLSRSSILGLVTATAAVALAVKVVRLALRRQVAQQVGRKFGRPVSGQLEADPAETSVPHSELAPTSGRSEGEPDFWIHIGHIEFDDDRFICDGRF